MRITRLAGLVAAGALALTAALPVAAADDAQVRVLHGSPDAPSVDVFVNAAKVDALSGLEFGKITDYSEGPRRHVRDQGLRDRRPPSARSVGST